MRRAIPYYIDETSNMMKELIRKEFEELKREGGFMKGSWKDEATYLDFMACDVPKFMGDLNAIVSTRWITVVEGKMCEKGEDWVGSCSRKEFKEMFNVEYAPGRARIREVDILRKKNNEKKELKRKQEHGDASAKRARYDYGKKGGGSQNRPRCGKCLNFYTGECCAKGGDPNYISRNYTKPITVCYGCNRFRHKLNECPKAKARDAGPLRAIKDEKTKAPKVKARAYPMTTEEAQLKFDVIIGIILVNSLSALVLYDSGAGVSFVSYGFSEKLSTPLNKLSKPLEVEIANSKVVVVTNMYREVDIDIDDSTFKITLIPMMLGKFDTVVGMDWLGKYDATILCSQKIIQIVNPNGMEIIIYGEKRKGELVLCSMMKT
ncbi:putative reverse transcriptase domain-containing protein [Tanacetum coccineum]